MLTAYLVCLSLGGLLVALAASAGISKDLERPDLGEHVFPVASELGLAGRATRRRWLPFLSFRFWTFGACFFGLSGVAMSQLSEWGESAVALASVTVGVTAGSGAAWLFGRLRVPVGAVSAAEGLIGQLGTLLHDLSPRGTSKARLEGADRELLVALATGEADPLPLGTRVVILAIEDGRATVVAADPALLVGPASGHAVRDTHPVDT